METTKKPWASVGMWGGVIAMIALNLKSFGIIDISAEDQGTMTAMIINLIEQGAVLVAMYGRYNAKKEVSL